MRSLGWTEVGQGNPGYFNASLDRVVEEAQKCVLLCANCHRIRHGGEDVDVNVYAS